MKVVIKLAIVDYKTKIPLFLVKLKINVAKNIFSRRDVLNAVTRTYWQGLRKSHYIND